MRQKEVTVCSTLELKWEALNDLLIIAKQIPDKLKKYIKTLLKALQTNLNSKIYEKARMLIDMLNRLINYAKKKGSDSADMCKMLYECEASYDSLSEIVADYYPDADVKKYFRSQGFDDPFTGMSFASGYDAFEYYACKLSLSNNISSYIYEKAKAIVEALDSLIDMTLEMANSNHYVAMIKAKLAIAIRMYENAIQDIIDIMNELDKFVNCGFAICDFASSAKNLQDDISSNYGVYRSISTKTNTSATSADTNTDATTQETSATGWKSVVRSGWVYIRADILDVWTKSINESNAALTSDLARVKILLSEFLGKKT